MKNLETKHSKNHKNNQINLIDEDFFRMVEEILNNKLA